ncbi:MAG TPA: hypothetical protein VLA48_02970 [Nitrososphaeraceae archaeon]|nr:hypothetical protein [Nitrososphaeraceae archaeon]
MEGNEIIIGGIIALGIPLWLIKHKLQEILDELKNNMTNTFKLRYRADEKEYKNSWLTFYIKRNRGTGFYLTYEKWGYFDERPQINTNLTSLLALILPFFSLYFLPISLILCFYSWGSIYINLPIKTGKNESTGGKTYGIMTYHPDSGFPTELWVRGWKSFNFPWAYDFLKREVLHKSGWRKEERGDDLWDKEKWKNEIVLESYPYTYTLNSGEKQERTATIYQEKRYWRRWFGLQTKCNHYIEIEFSDEVGERSGSWKGGVISCSYLINKGETALQCLQRMEKERKF